ncbi:PAS domain S-box-containing protein [Marivirga sericea]|uniref:PAS domain S-box-containing protein n=1 Tax=Marivirga sericea TaxID=1028 RepID=A0A1X7ILD7_9BACT|nr:PAS domain-containing protein [Marivirga sericea]SMG15786.1 PAS domain S-box-containing protein [Marivirga sericea]
MNIFLRLQNIGVDRNFDDYVNSKIRLSNAVALFNILFVAIPFSVISFLYVKELIAIPILGIVSMILVWVFNKISLIYLARILSALTPLLLAALFTSNLLKGNEELPVVMFLIMIAFSIIPFLVFDIRERGYLIFSVVFNFVIFVGVEYLPFVWIEKADLDFITEGFLFELNYIVSIVLIYTIVFMLAYINYRSELKGQRLIESNQKQTQDLHESENVLKKNLEEVQKAQNEEKNRAWVTEGLGRINSLTRQYDDPAALSKEVISEIVKYVDASQGAIYLVERDEGEEETFMEMKAAFAFGRRKGVKDRVKVGEGLIGQCYLEKDMIFLTEVPDDFVKIKSGLGDAPPKNIVIMPLMTNEKIEGILEVASFQVLPDYKVDYLKKLGESLATSFSMNKINANTKKLLELSQEQEEQMRSQAEELHQNMEELQATQEEMQRKNKETEEQNQQLQQQEEELRQNMEELSAQSDEMEKQMKEMEKIQAEMKAREDILNESTIISEADLFGTITYVNDKLIEVAKYSREEMLGEPHSLFRHPDMPSQIYKLMWDTIKSGKVFRGTVKNKAKDGSVYWVDAVISPVFDADGKPKKYIGVRYVIEQEKVAQKLFDQQLERLGLMRGN